MTSERVSLSAETTTQCVEIQLIEDSIVEMDEFFLVQLEQILSSQDLVFKPDPEYIEVTIGDNDGKIVFLYNIFACVVMYNYDLQRYGWDLVVHNTSSVKELVPFQKVCTLKKKMQSQSAQTSSSLLCCKPLQLQLTVGSLLL